VLTHKIFTCMQVVMVLKKEIMKTQNKELEKAAEYRHLLVHAMYKFGSTYNTALVSENEMNLLGHACR